jgi:hypothetical protein
VNHLTIPSSTSHWLNDMTSDKNVLVTAHSKVWSSNDKLRTALESSARAGACYVTRWRDQGILNSGATISAEINNAWSFSSTPPYVCKAWCLVKSLPFTSITTFYCSEGTGYRTSRSSDLKSCFVFWRSLVLISARIPVTLTRLSRLA